MTRTTMQRVGSRFPYSHIMYLTTGIEKATCYVLVDVCRISLIPSPITLNHLWPIKLRPDRIMGWLQVQVPGTFDRTE